MSPPARTHTAPPDIPGGATPPARRRADMRRPEPRA